jgi:hypothetical protein
LVDSVESLQAANAALRAANARLQSAPLGPVPTVHPAVTMSTDMLQQILGQIGAGNASTRVNPSAPKAKTGWAKILSDVETCLKDGEIPPVLKLSRANRARVQKEMKASIADRRFSLGGAGATLTLPGVDTDSRPLPTDKDSQLWSGLSAFFRLFSIMAAMPEEDFPRESLSEFLTVWSEIWDSPMGTHAQKLSASVAFYDKHADSLGTGVWLARFDSDSRFLLEHMQGDNPAPCGQCSGSGEGGLSNSDYTAGGSRGGGKGRGRGAGNGKGKRKAGSGKGGSICASMLVQSRSCDGQCGRSHSPCACCGGGCASAKQCVAWDQAAVNTKYADVLQRIQGAKRRAGK